MNKFIKKTKKCIFYISMVLKGILALLFAFFCMFGLFKFIIALYG